MDPESSYPIPDKQIAQSSSSKVIEDQSGHLDSQQQLQQREVDTNVSHVTETQQEQVELIEDTLPDHELDDDHLPPKSNTSVPPKLALQPTPVTFLQRPSSAGQDLTTAFCFGKATKLALNFAGHPSQKQKACKGSNLNLLKHGT